jgi:beta-lactamase regulating signal transducer with metallopeptidase domain
MNEFAAVLLWALLRTGLVMSVAALVLSLLLRVFRVASPTVRRIAYFAIVLQGCLLMQWPVALRLPTFVPEAIKPAEAQRPVPAAVKLAPSFVDRKGDAAQTRFAANAEVAPPNGVLPISDPSPPPSTFPWALGLVMLWGAGIAFLVGRSAWIYARFVRQLPPLQNVETEWGAEWDALQRQAGLRRLVPLAVAEQMGPVLCRLPRGYRLIVPALAWQTLEPSQRLLVLRHELAHIERRDVWKSLLMRVLALPHWFNPLVWRIVKRFDECAEWACDDATRQAAPDHLSGYARALLQLAHRAEPIFFATRAARGDGLSLRIRRLLTPAQEKGSKMKTAVLAMLLLGISLLNGTRLQSRADEEPPTTTNNKEEKSNSSAPQFEGLVVPSGTTPIAFEDDVRMEFVSKGPPHRATVDLRHILTNMREFQTDRQKLQSDLQALEKTRAHQEEEIRSLQRRVDEEKDRVARDDLIARMTQKRFYFPGWLAVENEKLVIQEREMYHRLLGKIVAEIGLYAKGHDIFMVRRTDFSIHPDIPPVAMPGRAAPTSQLAPISGELILGRSADGNLLMVTLHDFKTLNSAMVPPPPASSSADPTPAPPAAPPAQAAVLPPPLASALAAPLPPPAARMVPLYREAWNEEVIYVDGRVTAQEIDISKEILKRLNSAGVKHERPAAQKAK